MGPTPNLASNGAATRPNQDRATLRLPTPEAARADGQPSRAAGHSESPNTSAPQQDQSRQSNHKVKVLVVDDRPEKIGDREMILGAGFDGYIAKPIEPENFAEQVEAFLPPALRSAQ